MDLKQIRHIVELMNEHGLSYFHLEKKEYNIKLKKGPDMEDLGALMRSLPAAPAAAPAGAPAIAVAAGDPAAPIEMAAEEGEAVNSPMVGTFYTKPSPDAEIFAAVGATVSEGQTLCIIEAMKVMNEIKAERSGTICAVCVEDGTPVQYGDVLFRIK